MRVLALPRCLPQRMMPHPSTINNHTKGENP